MKNNKGFTLIELLAVILILGIIALIAVPTVNSVLQDSRVGAWKSTANNMASQAETYYQMRVIKDGPYITDFTTGATSDDNFAFLNGKEIEYTGDAELTDDNDLHDLMVSAILIKGDLPAMNDIEIFKVDDNGATIKFATANALCANVEGTLPDKMTKTAFASSVKTDATDVNYKLVPGASVQCAGIEK